MRVRDLAHELGLDPGDLLETLETMGITARSDATPLEPQHIAAVRNRIAPRLARPQTPQPEARPEAQPNPPAVAPRADPIPTDPMDAEWQKAMSGARRPVLLWGPPGSGKSTYVLALTYGQAPDPADPFYWSVMPVGERSSDWVNSVEEAYRAGGIAPSTAATEPPFRFVVTKQRRALELLGARLRRETPVLEADLLLLDPSGELFTVSKLGGRAGARVLDLFGQSRGLLLLIDPTEDQRTQQRMYFNMLVENIATMASWARKQPADVRNRILDSEGRIRLPTSVCVTKMDQFPDRYKDVKAFLQERIGPAFGLLEQSFSRMRVYGCSALGRSMQSTSDGPRVVGELAPQSVIEPLSWVLEQSEIKRSTVLDSLGW